ncbi:MAG TPA: NTP transferase domain-containing protein, partial [Armatimonadota bacterium]|nr:NTP transferase domain-containing protein [Armatimonadota bacterium]
MPDQKLACIILAAGQSKRMKSSHSKALHEICGKPLLCHVVDTLNKLQPERIVAVVSPETPDVVDLAGKIGIDTCYQHERLGTGHAALQAEELLGDFDGTILLTCVDIPLLRLETLTALREVHESNQSAATILTAEYDDPTGYGRIVRAESGTVTAIVEHRDADEATLAVREINSSVYCFRGRMMFELTKQVGTANDQGEMYLTDVISLMVDRGERVDAVIADDPAEIMGINNRVQLAEAEGLLRNRIRERLMLDGVSMVDPATTYVDDGVRIGRDTTIWPGAVIRGSTTIGEGCEIGPHAQIIDSTIGDGVLVKQGSQIIESEVGAEASVGPFAHIRPECVIGPGARAGSYIE